MLQELCAFHIRHVSEQIHPFLHFFTVAKGENPEC